MTNVTGIRWCTWMKQRLDWLLDWLRMPTETNVPFCSWVL